MDDGETLETHLLSYYRQSGVLPAQLDPPPIPYELSQVWGWWQDLNMCRAVGMDLCHITYTEIANWSILLKINVTAFEVRCIMAVDSAYLRCRSEQRARKSTSSK